MTTGGRRRLGAVGVFVACRGLLWLAMASCGLATASWKQLQPCRTMLWLARGGYGQLGACCGRPEATAGFGKAAEVAAGSGSTAMLRRGRGEDAVLGLEVRHSRPACSGWWKDGAWCVRVGAITGALSRWPGLAEVAASGSGWLRRLRLASMVAAPG